MNVPAPVTSAEALSENERTALLKLLADDDPRIYQAVLRRIMASGPQAGDWLRPHLLSSDPVVRRRSREIVRHFDRQETDTWFLAFCLRNGEELDLEEGAWLLAQTEYPDINVEAYQALLDSYAAVLHERIDAQTGSSRVLATINRYLFDELGFAGNDRSYHDPQNSYLNRVIDRRTGNPVSLCLLYMLLARRLRLPVVGIALPGHFLCRWQAADREVYIDAFNRGRFLAKAECVQYLLRGNHGLRQEFLTPVTSRRMLLRICANLHQVHIQLERSEEITRFQRYIIALTR